MEPLLFLVHRIPFPPNKGDKVRSFNLLKFLAARYRVHLGTFIDDANDARYVEHLQKYCASSCAVPLRPRMARVRSLAGLLTDEPLTLRYYRDDALARWVRDTVHQHHIAKAVVFSSAMAQYVEAIDGLQVVVDFVDVDSAKWTTYGRSRQWPLSSIYRREGVRLLAFERAVATRASASVFVTPAEAELFRELAPESAARIRCAQNGVDVEYFDPMHDLPSPYALDEEAVVFTGAMDYWPNIDAVAWFARDVMPAILASRPKARFYVVGMHPAPAVLALASEKGVVVTGLVPDVRPYLKHARVVVAPLRVARGIQNKVLEAMAMARPVVVSTRAAEGLSGIAGVEYETAVEAGDFIAATVRLMADNGSATMGAAARRRVVADYSWSANLAPFEALLAQPASVLVNAS